MVSVAAKSVRSLMRSRRPGLDMMILFVTGRCNAACETCFYHERLNGGGDLELDELRRLAATMPRFRDLWLSGGEPLLRDDLVEVCAAFVERCGVRTIDLPVNGLLPRRSRDVARALLDRLPGVELHVNVALDGLGERHDEIRAVPGNFARTEETLRALSELRASSDRLRVHVNTVICAANVDQVEAIGRHVLDRHRVDGHFFQVIRGTAKDPSLLEVALDDVRRLHRFAAGLHRHYAERLWRDRAGLDAWLKRATYVGTFLAHYEAQQGVLEDGRGWGYRCVAADGAIVVEHDGKVKACELRGEIADLREHGMDYGALVASGALGREAASIAAEPCPCTHVCFIHTSLRRSAVALARLPVRAIAGER